MDPHRSRHAPTLIALALVAAAWLLASAPLLAATRVDCPFDPKSLGDNTNFRGIIVPSYGGNNVRFVTLAYAAKTTGTYHITLLLRRNAFDGPVIGSPQTATVDLTGQDLAGGDRNTFFENKVTFDFGGAPVSVGDDLILTQFSSGPDSVFYDLGNGPCGSDYETTDRTPPVSTHKTTPDTSPGLKITDNDIASGCIPSDTVLCIDNNLGDRRFKVTMNFSTSQGGGLSGPGQAIPTKFLGVVHGGLMFFFSQDNPEVLVKVLDGCGVNGKFWVFITAGTNVHFSITVLDTVNGHFTTYNNPDLNPAPPIQDTSALPCP